MRMKQLFRTFSLFTSFRNFWAIFAPSNSYFTEKKSLSAPEIGSTWTEFLSQEKVCFWFVISSIFIRFDFDTLRGRPDENVLNYHGGDVCKHASVCIR